MLDLSPYFLNELWSSHHRGHVLLVPGDARLAASEVPHETESLGAKRMLVGDYQLGR